MFRRFDFSVLVEASGAGVVPAIVVFREVIYGNAAADAGGVNKLAVVNMNADMGDAAFVGIGKKDEIAGLEVVGIHLPA